MGHQYKTSFNVCSAWNYDKEIEDLNKSSEEGWQLVHGGMFHSRFVKDNEARYIYQLDYEPGIDNMGRYLETFREQGWEYVNSTLNGWNYFRKRYDPILPESEYEIFTDRASLQEMHDRWTRLATVLLVFLGILATIKTVMCIMEPYLPGFILLAVLLVEFFVLLHGVIIMKNPEKIKNDRNDGKRITVFLIVLIVGLVLTITLNSMRPPDSSRIGAAEFNPIGAELSESNQWNSIDIKYADWYYLDLEIDASAPVTVTLVNQKGETIYKKTEASFTVSDERLRLEKGTYRIHLSDFAGGRLDAEYELN